MKRFWILSIAVFAMFLVTGCGSESSNEPAGGNEDDFKAVDVGECRFDEPPLSFKDRIYTEQKDEFSCKEYVEVTEKAEKTIKFNWFGEMRCGIDWEYGYKIEGIENNVLKVSILERDTDLDLAADCDSCCYLMPIEYTASSAEEIDSIKTIEINYEGKNHKAAFPIDEETPEAPDEEAPLQCEYDGQNYDLGYEIATDICQTSTCTNGHFYFLDWLACEHCYYGGFDNPDNTTDNQGEIGDKQHFTCPDGSKVDWCECIADDKDELGRKWKCTDRADLNCPKE
ncbi:hypothetical protein IKO70_06185 [bacterium]|nr:hypothetical protein [bacterium]